MNRRPWRLALGAILLTLIGPPLRAQQLPDTAYAPPMLEPMYERGSGPRVAIDEAHLNFHTLSGGFRAFARLLEADGYRVGAHRASFSPASFDDVDVLVVANPLHADSEEAWAPLPNHSAFTVAEMDALGSWVAEGGALLLIADHMPIAGHAEALAARFGVRFQNGFALDSLGEGLATFRRGDGTLVASPVIEGVDSVTSFTGQAFRVDPDTRAEPVLLMPEGFRLLLPRVAWDFDASTPSIPAAHLFQGALVHHGRGRVAVFGEAAMFTAQRRGPEGLPMGMNHPKAEQNHRLVLNVLRWLSAERSGPAGGRN